MSFKLSGVAFVIGTDVISWNQTFSQADVSNLDR